MLKLGKLVVKRSAFVRNLMLLAVLLAAVAAAGVLAWQARRLAAPVPAGFLAAEKGYGASIDLARYDDDRLAETLVEIDDSGLAWLRLPVDWAEIEPEPGRFDWQTLDRTLAALESYPELELILVLQTSPGWARPAGTPEMTPPTEIGDLGQFAQALAGRYGDRLDFYQVWHEPNLSANWGNGYVDPAAYADMLREAALNIRQVDPQAVILAAALAPTLETGPLNQSDLAYLDQLYQAGAGQWFDVVAGQAYGFEAEPETPAGPDRLNFRRLELLRQVMLAHGDAETPIWATAFGWNALPDDWAGRPSPWHSAPPEVQAKRTAAAITYARQNWPWLGPLLAIRWDTAGLAENDPARGFALVETQPVWQAVARAAIAQPLATPGLYPAGHPTGQYSDGWRFALDRADIPRQAPRKLTIPFEGTRLDLLVTRGPYRGYLWVTVDGDATNALPQDEYGRSYVVLYDPLRQSQAVTLARDLPPGFHLAVIEAEGGWGQWAVNGWRVSGKVDPDPLWLGLAVAAILAGLSAGPLLWQLLRAPKRVIRWAWAWGEVLVALYAIIGSHGHILVTFGLAAAFYLAPPLASLLLLPLLALAVLLRPDLGLALTVFSLSFFQALKPLPGRAVSPVELALLLAAAGFAFRGWLLWGRAWFTPRPAPASLSQTAYPKSQVISQNPAPDIPNSPGGRLEPASLDWAALALVWLALLATLAASNFGVSLREWRVVVVESVLFYFLVRLGADFSPTRLAPGEAAPEGTGPTWRWAWRLVDAFVAGAALQALIALYLYFFTGQAITAEGVRRAMGLAYGSPNNLSLFLGRAWPVLLAVALFPGPVVALRRRLYGAGLVVVSLALYLTFSKGALLLGLPASLLAMALFYGYRHHHQGQWRRVLLIAAAGVIVIGLALVPLSRTDRFRSLLDFSQGSTGFFRLKLWQASWAMLREHWPLGVGLDNFLYQYRTRYILPEAWQEPNLSHPHNLFLDFGTRLGVGGLVLLLWLQGAFWRSAWLLYRRYPVPLVLGLMGSMVTFIGHGLVDNSYFLVDLAFIFFLTAGMVQRLAEQTGQ